MLSWTRLQSNTHLAPKIKFESFSCEGFQTDIYQCLSYSQWKICSLYRSCTPSSQLFVPPCPTNLALPWFGQSFLSRVCLSLATSFERDFMTYAISSDHLGANFQWKWFGSGPEGQSYKPKVGVTAGQTPESEPNRQDKQPEWCLGASAEDHPYSLLEST